MLRQPRCRWYPQCALPCMSGFGVLPDTYAKTMALLPSPQRAANYCLDTFTYRAMVQGKAFACMQACPARAIFASCMHGMQSSAMPGRTIEALLCCTPGRLAAQHGCAIAQAPST